jgi:hypothetical protein
LGGTREILRPLGHRMTLKLEDAAGYGTKEKARR